MKLEKTLQNITSLIVQCCDPETVLLFGSYAKEQDNLDSDLDILVIGNFREASYFLKQEVRELLHRYPIRIDVHLLTPEELAIETQSSYGFFSSVVNSSVVLYNKK